MYNQHRLLRLFQLINYLQAPPAKYIQQLKRMLDTSERSVYRYLDLLREAGFDVQRDAQNKYYIPATPDDMQVPFTPQEADYLVSLINTMGMEHPMAQSLLQKLSQLSTQEVAARNIFQAHQARMIDQLGYAILHRRQVRLLNYHSVHSQQISHRVVEPNRFTDNYVVIAAYEPASGQNKYFSIQRIGGVEVLESPMQHEDKHAYHAPDMFGFQGTELDKEVSWRMTLRAMLLLKQAHPLTATAIQQDKDGQYVFTARVQSFAAPASFVLGLPEEVQVTGSEGFLRFIEEKRG